MQACADARHLAPVEHEPRRRLGRLLHPVDDADVHDRLARPPLAGDGIGDHAAVLDDVVEAGATGAVLRDGVGADQAGATARLEAVGRLAEPVDAQVLHAAAELLAEPLEVLGAVDPAQVLGAVVGRIADDRVGARPRVAQRVLDDDAGEIGERERALVQAEFLDRQPVAHPQRDAGEGHGEALDLDAADVRQGEEQRQRLRGRLAGRPAQLGETVRQAALDPAQLAVGDVEEVAAPARGVQDDVAHQVRLGLRRLGGRLEVLDALPPRPHDRGLDDLLDLGLVGVVRADLPLAVVPERALEQVPEDLGLHLAPVLLAGGAENLELFPDEVQAGGAAEQRPVRVRRPRIHAVLGPLRGGIVEVLEEAAQVVRAGAVRVGDQPFEDPGEPVPRDLPEILGEHAPHRLQEEVAPLVGAANPAIGEHGVQGAEAPDGVDRHRGLAALEDGRVAGEEEQRVVGVGQLGQGERRARLGREQAGLPDLERVECTQHDVARGRHPGAGICRFTPVVERLAAVVREPAGLAGRLHLEETATGPQQVHEPAALVDLEARDRLAAHSVAVEQLVEERLRLRALGPLVEAPLGRERRQARADLFAGHRPGQTASLSWPGTA